MTILLVLIYLYGSQNLVKKARKMITKAVKPMRRAWKKITSSKIVLTGGFLAWTGRDDSLA